jgi:hypothetical protein
VELTSDDYVKEKFPNFKVEVGMMFKDKLQVRNVIKEYAMG